MTNLNGEIRFSRRGNRLVAIKGSTKFVATKYAFNGGWEAALYPLKPKLGMPFKGMPFDTAHEAVAYLQREWNDLSA